MAPLRWVLRSLAPFYSVPFKCILCALIALQTQNKAGLRVKSLYSPDGRGAAGLDSSDTNCLVNREAIALEWGGWGSLFAARKNARTSQRPFVCPTQCPDSGGLKIHSPGKGFHQNVLENAKQGQIGELHAAPIILRMLVW